LFSLKGKVQEVPVGHTKKNNSRDRANTVPVGHTKNTLRDRAKKSIAQISKWALVLIHRVAIIALLTG
jgi:hypothetical protein